MTTQLILFWMTCASVNIYIITKLFINYGNRTIYFSFFINFLAQTLLLPFAFDYRNVFAVGRNFSPIVRTLPDAAYFYVGLSTLFMVTFYFFLSPFNRRPLRRWGLFFRICDTAARSASICSVIVAVQAGLAILLVLFGVAYGGGIQDILQNSTIRPIANLWSIWSIYAISFAVIRTYFARTPRAVIELLVALASAAVTGQRGVILVPIVIGVIAILTAIRSRGFGVLAALVIALVPAAILFSNLRSDASARAAYTAPGLSSTEAAVFSNNFSDVRDFAWVLSTYNNQPLGGRTFIAGYTALIPSGVWPLRKDWAYGTFTARSTHLDEDKIGGLRTGLFSEVLFNFGTVAALAAAIVLGILAARLFALELKRETYLDDARSRAANAFSTYMMFAIYCSFIFTPTFFSVYVAGFFVAFVFVIGFLFRGRVQ